MSTLEPDRHTLADSSAMPQEDRQAVRILLVDDNPEDRVLVARALRGEFSSLHLIEVIETQQFQAALGRDEFDLVITDFQLRWTDGLKVLQAVKAHDPHRPVIMFTATGTQEIAVAAMKAGLDDYVIKSVKHYARLPAAVRSALRQSQQRRALAASEQRLQAILDNAPAVVCLKDLRGRYLLVNRRFETLFGIQRGSFPGRTDRDLFPPEQADRLIANDRQVVQSGQPIEFEEQIAQQGREHTYLSSKFPLRDSQGRIYAVCGISTDVTEWRQAEKGLRAAQAELRVARQIQAGMLPSRPPRLAGYDIAGGCFMAETVGGDYYDYLPMPGHAYGITVGDAAGHGLSAALLVIQAAAALQALSREGQDVGHILTRVNVTLTPHLPPDRFVALLLIRLEPATGALSYASAGHPPAYLLDRAGETRIVLDSLEVPLGVADPVTFPTRTGLQMHPGDLMFLFTDGVFEAYCAQPRQMFGIQRALQVVRTHRKESAAKILRILMDEVQQFCGGLERRDDMTAVIIKRIK